MTNTTHTLTKRLLRKAGLIALASTLVIAPAVGTVAIADTGAQSQLIQVIPTDPTVQFDADGYPYVVFPDITGITYEISYDFITSDSYIYGVDATPQDGYEFPWGSTPNSYYLSGHYTPTNATVIEQVEAPYLTGELDFDTELPIVFFNDTESYGYWFNVHEITDTHVTYYLMAYAKQGYTFAPHTTVEWFIEAPHSLTVIPAEGHIAPVYRTADNLPAMFEPNYTLPEIANVEWTELDLSNSEWWSKQFTATANSGYIFSNGERVIHFFTSYPRILGTQLPDPTVPELTGLTVAGEYPTYEPVTITGATHTVEEEVSDWDENTKIVTIRYTAEAGHYFIELGQPSNTAITQFSITRNPDADTATIVVPAAPTVIITAGEDPTVFLPTIAGVNYEILSSYIDWWSNSYRFNVTATPQDGYAFPHGATTDWYLTGEGEMSKQLSDPAVMPTATGHTPDTVTLPTVKGLNYELVGMFNDERSGNLGHTVYEIRVTAEQGYLINGVIGTAETPEQLTEQQTVVLYVEHEWVEFSLQEQNFYRLTIVKEPTEEDSTVTYRWTLHLPEPRAGITFATEDGETEWFEDITVPYSQYPHTVQFPDLYINMPAYGVSTNINYIEATGLMPIHYFIEYPNLTCPDGSYIGWHADRVCPQIDGELPPVEEEELPPVVEEEEEEQPADEEEPVVEEEEETVTTTPPTPTTPATPNPSAPVLVNTGTDSVPLLITLGGVLTLTGLTLTLIARTRKQKQAQQA